MNSMLQSSSNAFGAGAGGIVGTVAGFAAILLVIFVALRLTGIVKSGQPVYYIGRLCKILIEMPIKAVLRPLIWAARKIPGASRAVNWFATAFSDASIEAWFDRKFADSPEAVLRGDLETAARRRWPEEKYPHLWMYVPPDLELQDVQDGRLIDGSRPAVVFAPSFVDTTLVGQSFRRAVLSGLFWAFVALLVWHPRLYLGTPMDTALADSAARPSKMSMEQRAQNSGFDLAYKTLGVQLQEDAWDLETMNRKIKDQAESQRDVMQARRESIIGNTSGGILTALLLGLVVFYGSFRGLVRDAAQDRVEPLRRQLKSATVLWKLRFADRELQFEAYKRQLRKATGYDKDSPVIALGTATGLMQFRGALGVPQRGQRVVYTLEDMSAGTLLSGATAGGKTSLVIIPIYIQLLALRKQAIDESDPLRISFYCTDGKGVLWRDMKQAAEDAGQGADVRVIGCNEEAGQYGVDVLDGVDPALVADTIKSVMEQANGGSTGGDVMWPTLAGIVIQHSAIICQAWELTLDGDSLIRASGERVYSLAMIYQVAMDATLQTRAIRAILAAMESPEEWPVMVTVANVALFDSMRYMQDKWIGMTPATKMGIEANITAACSGFASNVALRRAFASASGSRLMTVSEAWGSICLVDLSNITYGLAGRIINILLKSLLFTTARKREMADPRIGARQKLGFMCDEYQDLISASATGLSDTNFAAVCRSTGLFYFVACQSLASLEQSIGALPARSFVQQMRNRICLRTEDGPTVDFLVENAGETERSYMYADDLYESYDAMVRELGYDPIEAGPARLSEKPSHIQSTVIRAVTLAHRASMPITFDTHREAYDYDDRFIPRSSKASEESVLSAMQAAAFRQADLNRETLKEGNHKTNLLHKEDLNNMGQAMAYVFVNRAGAMRQDIVMLDTER